RLRLADADGLDDHDVESRGLREQDRLACPTRDAAQRGPGGRRPDEGAGLARELSHARLVAQERSAAPFRGRIDCQHGDLMPALKARETEGLDESRFSDTGGA